MKKINNKKSQYNTPYTHLCMIMFSKVNDSLYSSYSGMSIRKYTGNIGSLVLSDDWVLFSKEGLYIDHDKDIELLAKRKRLDLSESTF